MYTLVGAEAMDMDRIEMSKSNTGLRATPGITHICPYCKRLLYSDELSRELHKESCTANQIDSDYTTTRRSGN